MRRVITVCGLLILILAILTPDTGAEVAVRTDERGEYVTTVVVPGGPPWRPGIWGKRARYGMREQPNVLNPRGDRLGDRIPRIVESSVAPHHPLAVWSRFNGRDFDLVWSHWQRSWSRISPVVSGLPMGDDLDPDIAFALNGHPLLTWWNRDSNDHGTVYFSMMVDSGWIEPLKISTDDFGGRHPSLRVTRTGRIIVTYESDDGELRMAQPLVLTTHPDTITDDIDPQGAFMFLRARVTYKEESANP